MRRKGSKLVAVDWDGTLVEHPPNIPFEEVLTYDAQPYAAKVVTYLVKECGIRIYVLTSRPKEEHKRIEEWLKTHGFPELEVTNIKRENIWILIDDRAYRFDNWLNIGKLLQ